MDKTRFSIIIPVLHESERINSLIDHIHCLARDNGHEIIVVDGSPGKDTIGAIRSKGVIKLSTGKDRARQMNAGAFLAKGEILIFLHADTELPARAFARIDSIMKGNRCVAGAFSLGIRSKKFFLKSLARLASLRCRITRIPYGDQGIFIRGDYFRRIGGYRELPIMEDVELMRRVKHRGEKICILSDHVMTSARRWEEEGFLFGLLRNTILFTLFILCVSPEKLARFYKSEYRGMRQRKHIASFHCI
jgi:rSAM/selenodomain-associated transferase 2